MDFVIVVLFLETFDESGVASGVQISVLHVGVHDVVRGLIVAQLELLPGSISAPD